MQTFLAYPDYLESMRCLDKSRLGNQVWREGITLIRGGWPNHPASKMWRGHEYHLGLYLLAGIEVLRERGKYYVEVCKKINVEMAKFRDTGPPTWLGGPIHSSHRAALLYKNYSHYSQFGWKEIPQIQYVWPV